MNARLASFSPYRFPFTQALCTSVVHIFILRFVYLFKTLIYLF